MATLYERITEASRQIRGEWNKTPQVGIVLGTGLSGFSEEIDVDLTIDYEKVPHFPTSTVESHTGQLVCGALAGTAVLAMEGRFHFYEGYTMQQLTFPVRVMRELGVEVLIISNACGGMNPHHEIGDIVVIEDHINLMGDNPLIGNNDERLGPRFPDMSEPYDRALIRMAEAVALSNQIRAHRGVYVAVAGPNLETRAEYRFLRALGSDVVGMSTVPEVIVGVHAGLKVLGLSVVTDLCLPDALQPANVQEIIRAANEAEPKLRAIVRGVINQLKADGSQL